MRIVYAGTPEVAVPVLDAIAVSQHELVGVVTRPDAPAGRGKRLQASPVGVRADQLGVPLSKPKHPRDGDFHDWLRALDADVVVVVAYGALVPQPVLEIPRHGWINLHFSLLPAWRGAAPVQHSLLAGEHITGASVFRLVPELDAGPIYRTITYDVPPDASAGQVLGVLADAGGPLVLATLDDIASGVQPSPQPADGVSLAPKITVDDARIDWRQPASRVHNLVRGTNPDPGAWTLLDGQRFKVLRTSVLEAHELAPGEIRAERRRLLAGTGDRDLLLADVQAVGKKPMAGADWARGVTLAPGARFA